MLIYWKSISLVAHVLVVTSYNKYQRGQCMGAGTGGEQGGQAPTLEKIRVGIAHPGNFSRGLKTFWQ